MDQLFISNRSPLVVEVRLDCLEHILRQKSRGLTFLGLISQINDFHLFYHLHLLHSPIYHRFYHLHHLHHWLHLWLHLWLHHWLHHWLHLHLLHVFFSFLHHHIHCFCFFFLINRLFHEFLEFHASCWPMGHILFLEDFVVDVHELCQRQLRHHLKVLETHDSMRKIRERDTETGSCVWYMMLFYME